MYVRKNATSLSEQEKEAFVEGLLALKRQGRYDEYVHMHHATMIPSVWPFEPRDPNYRTGMHRGPSFLPWHRSSLATFNTNILQLSDTPTPLTGVCCTRYVGKEPHVKVQDSYLPSF